MTYSYSNLGINKIHILIKALFVINFSLITYILQILRKSTISGYEESIYSNLPVILWAAIFFISLSSILIIIYYLIVSKIPFIYICLSFILLFLIRIIILLLPYIKGYISWDSDLLFHYGMIIDMLSSGSVSYSNVYPILHIYLSELCLISGINSLKFISHFNIYSSTIYLFGIYTLSKCLFDNKEYSLISVLVIILVFFDRYSIFISPNGLSIFLIPLLFYSYFKEGWNFKIVSLILIILYAYIHPLSSVFVTMTLIIMYFTDMFHSMYGKGYKNVRSPFNSVSILLAFFLPWVLSFKVFQHKVNSFVDSLTSSEDISSPLSLVEHTAGRLDIQSFELFKLISKSMGDDVIFLTISLVTLFIYIGKIIFNYDLLLPSKKIEKILSIFVITLLVYLSYMFGLSSSLSFFEPSRLLSYHQIVTPLITAFFLYNFINLKVVRKKITIFIVLIILIIPSSISIYSLYPSHCTLESNLGVRNINVQGISWHLQHKNTTIGNVRILVLPSRYSSIILGKAESRNRVDLSEISVSDHFNYTNNTYFGESYDDDKYFTLFESEIIVYSTIWEKAKRFNYHDFEHLDYDNSLNKLYVNSDLTVYHVKPAL